MPLFYIFEPFVMKTSEPSDPHGVEVCLPTKTRRTSTGLYVRVVLPHAMPSLWGSPFYRHAPRVAAQEWI